MQTGRTQCADGRWIDDPETCSECIDGRNLMQKPDPFEWVTLIFALAICIVIAAIVEGHTP